MVKYTKLTGAVAILYVHDKLPLTLLNGRHVGEVVKVRDKTTSFDQNKGNERRIIPEDGIGFFGVSDMVSFERVRIVEPLADMLHDENKPGDDVKLGK